MALPRAQVVSSRHTLSMSFKLLLALYYFQMISFPYILSLVRECFFFFLRNRNSLLKFSAEKAMQDISILFFFFLVDFVIH